MQVGWPGLSRAIAASIVLTSIFWIALGVWLYRNHLAADRSLRGAAVEAASTAATVSGVVGALSGSASQSRDRGARSLLPTVMPSGLAIPVAGVTPAQLTDTFSQGRAEGARHHDAIDILAAEGTAVQAAAPGRVEKLFYSADGGNTIYVRSADRRLIYYYAHLLAYDPSLREGEMVRQGQSLGQVGHTGNADAAAPHLHFAIWSVDPVGDWSQQGVALNPFPLLHDGAGRR